MHRPPPPPPPPTYTLSLKSWFSDIFTGGNMVVSFRSEIGGAELTLKSRRMIWKIYTSTYARGKCVFPTTNAEQNLVTEANIGGRKVEILWDKEQDIG